jgi:hypothetical protein
MIDIGPDTKVEVSEFKGKWYVEIRKWYQDDKGEWARTQKGINMPLETWNVMMSKLDEITAMIKEKIN